MKKIAFVTDVPFWKKTAGNEQRVSQVLEMLCAAAAVSLFYIGSISKKDYESLKKQNFSDVYGISCWKQDLKNGIKNVVTQYFPYLRKYLKRIRKPGSLETRKSSAVADFVKKKFDENGYDVLWVEYVWLTYLFDSAPSDVLKFVDTHDVQYDRCASFARIGLNYDFQITKDEEVESLEKADYVLAINSRDNEILSRDLKNVLVYPYIPFLGEEKQEIVTSNEGKNRVAFIGSPIDFNIKSVEWFIANVWPLILEKKPNAEFHVYGKVSNYVKKERNVYAHGFVKNSSDIYRDNRIFVNPILMGGGLKIKCVEALLYGKPLVTTSVGAQGIEDGCGSAFLVADEAKYFAEYVVNFLNVDDVASLYSTKAQKFINEMLWSTKQAEENIKKIIGMV